MKWIGVEREMLSLYGRELAIHWCIESFFVFMLIMDIYSVMSQG